MYIIDSNGLYSNSVNSLCFPTLTTGWKGAVNIILQTSGPATLPSPCRKLQRGPSHWKKIWKYGRKAVFARSRKPQEIKPQDQVIAPITTACRGHEWQLAHVYKMHLENISQDSVWPILARSRLLTSTFNLSISEHSNLIGYSSNFV